VSPVGAPSAGPKRLDLLAGLRVLELGDGVAGSAAGSVLWALGADVTAVVDPASLHRRGRPSAGSDAVSLLALVLDRGKQLLEVDDRAVLDELLAETFDVVIVDRVGGTEGALSGLADVATYAEFVARHNRRAWVTISAFGLSGERAQDIATELTVAAASGLLGSVRSGATGKPVKLAGQQSLLNTGQAAALAACHALDLAAHDGPSHLDLSAVEATVATGPVLEIACLLFNTGERGGAKRYGAPASFYECSDGLLRITAMEDHQWRGVVEAMGSPAWAERFATVQARIDDPDEIDRQIAAWARTRSKIETETLLQANGVPATAMYSPAELLASPQLAHREAFESLPLDDGRTATIVNGVPARLVATHGERRKRSLRGLRMLEAGHVLAAPLGGALLAAMGAEVTKLEDVGRLDMYRRRGPYIDGQAGMERSAYFALVNHSKRSAAFDVDADRDHLEALLDESDVVLENLGAKRAATLGIAASSIGAKHPDLLAVSSSGFGQEGPHARYRAYAYNLQSACGVVYLTRTEEGERAEIDMAWADLITAYALATLIAAWAVGPEGNTGFGLDVAMADLIVAHFNEFLAAASIDPEAEASFDWVNELTPFAPHGVYPAGDRWVALAVADDEQYAALVKVLGDDGLSEEAFATAAARSRAHRALDERVGAATRGRDADELAAELRACGVAAEVVLLVADLVEEPQLAERGFFTEIEHEEWGRRRVVGIPWRPYGGPPIALGSPPVLRPIETKGVT
jgi:crotonobetainyl-CoA:carnitine CoA-transferase CaiB-like acyl-CoA transferase